VGDQRRARRTAEAGDDVEDSGREQVGCQLSEPEGGDRVLSAGLRTTVLPVASAGPIFQIAISSGISRV